MRLNEFNLKPQNNLIGKIYIANSYANLGNNKIAKSIVKLDSIKNVIDNLDILECAQLLKYSNNLKNTQKNT